jgi:aminopeptidase N
MFPFYMGTNETKYAWMDEGWATIGEWLISPMIDSTIRNDYGIMPYAISSGTEDDLPIATLTTQQTGTGNFINSYAKPAMAYLYVKELLGDELFTKALHHYINNWKGKHPIPYDFFNSINAGSGRNLNWLWKAWFFDGGYPDLAISKASFSAGELKIAVDNKGGKPLPVHLRITYADGSVQEVKRNIGVWEKGNRQTIVAVKTSKKPRKIELGSLHISDKNPKDNVFEVK